MVKVEKTDGSGEMHTVELYAKDRDDAKTNVVYASPDYRVVKVMRVHKRGRV